MKYYIRKCKTVILLGVYLVIAEVFLIFMKWDTEQKPRARISSTLNYKHFIQFPGERTDWRRAVQVFNTRDSPNEKFLTIGIPTVRREKSSYFFECFGSLLNCTGTDDMKDIVFVIYLGDFNQTWKEEMANKLQRQYPKLIENGTIRVIESQWDFYPQLDNLKHTFNDSEARTRWRSKQNVDFAFLWLYSLYLGQYYMQIEDDVLTMPGYMSIIRQFISEQKNEWTCLEFSQMGFIGKLFHSKDLELLAKTILLFYDKQPVDFLYQYFNALNLQRGRIFRRPTIFRHIGFHSSLSGKTMEAVDTYFDDAQKSMKGDNPPAKLFTTLRQSTDFPLENAYSSQDGYFWAHSSPKVNDTISILFNQPQSLRRISVITGSKGHKRDILEHGRLDVCMRIHLGPTNDAKTVLGTFVNGTVHINNVFQLIKGTISSLQITATASQNFWLIVKEIAVFNKI